MSQNIMRTWLSLRISQTGAQQHWRKSCNNADWGLVFESQLLHPCTSSSLTSPPLPPNGCFRPLAMHPHFPLYLSSSPLCCSTLPPTLLRNRRFQTFVPIKALFWHTSAWAPVLTSWPSVEEWSSLRLSHPRLLSSGLGFTCYPLSI